MAEAAFKEPSVDAVDDASLRIPYFEELKSQNFIQLNHDYLLKILSYIKKVQEYNKNK